MMSSTKGSVIALDYGAKRIGVARAHCQLAIAQPMTVLLNNDGLFREIISLITTEHVQKIIVGLPRNLSGEDTLQTVQVRAFVRQLRSHVSVPVVLQDEAGTSNQAQVELRERGVSGKKSRQESATTSIDALAATYILEDFITQGGLR